jgi:hypothetical protein
MGGTSAFEFLGASVLFEMIKSEASYLTVLATAP